MPKHYDYIITGGGLAGLSLLHYLLHSELRDKQILLLDKAKKTDNDRTWCFWEREKNAFEDLVYHRWRHLDFHTPDYSATLDIAPYEYKMIRGIDFYQACEKLRKSRPNVEKSVENVQNVVNTDTGVLVTTDKNTYTADYCFNSILFNPPSQADNLYLAQHFKGWIIRTPQPAFDPQRAVLMDFRIPHAGDTRFVYVLPVSPTEALLEATLFSPELLPDEAYDQMIKDYLREYLPHIRDYEILHEEDGVIPMTDYKFSRGTGHIVNIGTAGGHTKASSGYTFYFTQKELQRLVNQFVRTGNPHLQKTAAQKRGAWADRILLDVLQHQRLAPPALFGRLFAKNKPAQVLKFMAEETTIWEEIKIMSSLQIWPFFRGMLHTL